MVARPKPYDLLTINPGVYVPALRWCDLSGWPEWSEANSGAVARVAKARSRASRRAMAFAAQPGTPAPGLRCAPPGLRPLAPRGQKSAAFTACNHAFDAENRCEDVLHADTDSCRCADRAARTCESRRRADAVPGIGAAAQRGRRGP